MFFLDKLDLIVNRALEGVLNNSVRHVDVRYYLGVQIGFLQETLILVARVQDVDKLCFQTCQTVGHYECYTNLKSISIYMYENEHRKNSKI